MPFKICGGYRSEEGFYTHQQLCEVSGLRSTMFKRISDPPGNVTGL